MAFCNRGGTVGTVYKRHQYWTGSGATRKPTDTCKACDHVKAIKPEVPYDNRQALLERLSIPVQVPVVQEKQD